MAQARHARHDGDLHDAPTARDGVKHTRGIEDVIEARVYPRFTTPEREDTIRLKFDC